MSDEWSTEHADVNEAMFSALRDGDFDSARILHAVLCDIERAEKARKAA